MLEVLYHTRRAMFIKQTAGFRMGRSRNHHPPYGKNLRSMKVGENILAELGQRLPTVPLIVREGECVDKINRGIINLRPVAAAIQEIDHFAAFAPRSFRYQRRK